MSDRKIPGTMMAWLCAAVLAFCTSMTGCGSASGVTTTPPPLLSIVTASLPDGTIGSAYTQTIQATGGVAPFTWAVTSGALPHGLTPGSSASESVTISGTPDMVQSAVAFTIRVTDAQSASATQSYSVNIKSSPTVVQTQSGLVQGTAEGNLLVFRGIPFAAPPVGNLRWRPPQPPLSWKGIRSFTTFGNPCPQISGSGQLSGNEDCLTLNVFISQAAPGPKQPVMVFLHGGGGFRGSTEQPIYDATPLATQGVIVVTVEYRLGLLGLFANSLLSAEGGGSSGNYSVMDQIAALGWVRQNIAAFAGDPAHVMVFGQSAGAAFVEALLVAPAAQGLFSAAGMESGGFPHGHPTLTDVETMDAPIVSALGCSSAADVLACLRAVPADVIVSNQSAAPIHIAIQSPVVPGDPFDTLQQNGSPVPLLIGSNSEEAADYGGSDDPTAPLDETGYEAAVHAEFDPILTGAGNQVLALYPATAYDSPRYALIAVDSDFGGTCTVRNLARAAAGPNRPPVWRYLYTHRFENSAFLNPLRAFHTAELSFVLRNADLTFGGSYTPTAAEVTLAKQIMDYWTRFAATGDPNGSGAVPWPGYDATTDAMLQLDDTQMAINGYHNPQCDFLSTLPQP